jgi:outer membrane immunogenic protein
MRRKSLQIHLRAEAALVVIAALSAAPALAADLPVKAPPVAPAPATDWTGFYADATAGWHQSNTTWLYANFPGELAAKMNSNGGVFGGHLGYQHQFGWLVLGGEFGAAGPINNNLASFVSAGPAGPAPCLTAVAGDMCQTRMGDNIMWGGKAGVDWGNWLAYGVGGWARGSIASSGAGPSGASFDPSNGSKNTGYYAGGGFDYMLAQTRLLSLIAGFEYIHVQLNTALQTSPADAFNPAGINARVIGGKQDIVWGKLTVKFNPWNL